MSAIDKNIGTLCIGDLLDKNLCIPEYQRPYRWDDEQIFEFFIKHFINAGYVDEKVKRIFELSKEKVDSEPEKYLDFAKELLESVRKLHDSMDNSLRFNVSKKK